MPLQQTSGNVTQDAYGGGASAVPVYVENVFSTYLYTGTGAAQTINNGIDLSTKGGFVWIKIRDVTGNNNSFDTAQGAGKYLVTNTTDATVTDATTLTSFNTNGFSLGADRFAGYVNGNGNKFVSWTFRKQPKFFDVVTYTGNGTSQNIAHNLGSVPGAIIVKRTDTTSNWAVYHNGLNGGSTPEQYVCFLNTNDANASTTNWNNTAPTSTQFSVGVSTTTNASGGTYIAYIYASNAGGFGLTRTNSIISCGYYTGNGSTSGPFINLGWEPQWILIKDTSQSANWTINDVMRGMSYTSDSYLNPNTSNAESTASIGIIQPNAKGFTLVFDGTNWNESGDNYIYIAIRRGPMAVPTDPTTVFVPVAATPSGATTVTTNFPVDINISTVISSNGYDRQDWDRLRGSSQSSGVILYTDTTAAEGSDPYGGIGFDSNTSIVDNWWNSRGGVTTPVIYWNFARAPGFFDEVCYTGTGSATTQSHNLGVVPQMIIAKSRSTSSTNWIVYNNTIGNSNVLYLNTTAASTSNNSWNNISPTSTVFSVNNNTNNSGQTFAAYLFATLAGVSKVGSYTGNGTGQSIACGFGAAGARFVLIKRTDSTGNWYVFDSANGLTSSSSPYLLWNSAAAQVTGNNGVYASSGGFTLGATAVTTTNIATASYIFLAIA